MTEVGRIHRRRKRFPSLHSIRVELAAIYNDWQEGSITDATDFRATVFCLKAIADVLQLEKGEAIDERLAELEEQVATWRQPA